MKYDNNIKNIQQLALDISFMIRQLTITHVLIGCTTFSRTIKTIYSIFKSLHLHHINTVT